jgi:methionyl-tRNA formyltransferase
MRYIFFGTPTFAKIVLKELIDSKIPPIAIITNPDRPFGRKKIIKEPETKKLVLEYNEKNQEKINIFQPEKIDDKFIKEISEQNPELFVVAAYSKIIPQNVLDIAKFGAIGVHPSLLPKYRGTSPIQSVLLNGEDETGVTIYKIDEKIDHGEIILKEKYKISEEDDYESLVYKLGNIGGQLAVKTINEFEKVIKEMRQQDESQATFTKKFKTEDGYVTPEDLKEAMNGNIEIAKKILNKIRGLNREPGVWTIANDLSNKHISIKDGERVKILKAKIINEKLALIQIQREGQKPIYFEKI